MRWGPTVGKSCNDAIVRLDGAVCSLCRAASSDLDVQAMITKIYGGLRGVQSVKFGHYNFSISFTYFGDRRQRGSNLL
jgi:hypothetical protein